MDRSDPGHAPGLCFSGLNDLLLKPEADVAKLTALFDRFFTEVRRQHPKMKTALRLKPSDNEATFINIY